MNALSRRLLFAAALVAAAAPLACRKPGQKESTLTGNEVVLKVGDHVITLRDFFVDYDRAKLERGITGDPQAALALKNALLSETLKRELILRRAREAGITVQAEEVAAEIGRIRVHYPGDSFREMLAEQYVAYDEWIERQKVRLLVEKVIDQELESKITVTDEESRAWFAAHPEIAQQRPKVRLMQILVSREEEAKLLRSRLVRGDDFAALARERSVSPEGPTGGELGVFSAGEVPEMMDVVFTIPAGELSDVVQSEYGFHLFKVVETMPGRTLGFEDVRPKVTEAVRASKVQEAFPTWLRTLADGVTVERNDALLAAIE
jgi:peptidyl-prolyl cis-trans isomerase C